MCHQMFQHRQHKSMCKVRMEGVSFSARAVGRVVWWVVCVSWQLRDATNQSIPGKMLQWIMMTSLFISTIRCSWSVEICRIITQWRCTIRLHVDWRHGEEHRFFFFFFICLQPCFWSAIRRETSKKHYLLVTYSSSSSSFCGGSGAGVGWCFCTILIPPAFTVAQREFFRHSHSRWL